MSTVAVRAPETNSWRWPIFMVVMMNALAWIASFAVYQGGKLMGLGERGWQDLVAALTAALAGGGF